MSAFRLDRATAADAAILAALHAATIGARFGGQSGEGWSATWFEQMLALPGPMAVLARNGEGIPVGFALCLPAGDVCDLAALGVLAEWRRSGIGAALVAHCIDHARATGACRVLLEVAEDNAAARALYGRSGFVQMRRLPNYYAPSNDGGSRHALVLSKTL